MGVRSTAKAIITNQNKILLNKCYDEHNGEYYSLPGGGQNPYETLQEAVVRECLEETGYHVAPKKFVALCEIICDDPEMRKNRPEYAHKMYHIFLCELAGNAVKKPTEVDDMQVCSEWIEIKNLSQIRLLPTLLNDNIGTVIHNTEGAMYLGAEHVRHNHG